MTAEDVGAAHKILGVFDAFRAVSPTMPLQLAQTFVLVMLNEGTSLVELCRITGFAQSTMSRHLLDLGMKNRMGEPGHGLVEGKIDPHELRRKMFTLTPKGRALARTILAHVKGSGPGVVAGRRRA